MQVYQVYSKYKAIYLNLAIKGKCEIGKLRKLAFQFRLLNIGCDYIKYFMYKAIYFHLSFEGPAPQSARCEISFSASALKHRAKVYQVYRKYKTIYLHLSFRGQNAAIGKCENLFFSFGPYALDSTISSI